MFNIRHRITVKMRVITLEVLNIAMAGIIIFSAYDMVTQIGMEIKNIAHHDIPLTQKLTKIEQHYLHQEIALERALRNAGIAEKGKKATESYQQDKERFNGFSKQVAEEIAQAEKLLAASIEDAVDEETRRELTTALEQLKTIETTYTALELHAHEVFVAIDSGDLSEALTLTKNLEAEDEQFNQHLETVFAKIEKFTETAILITERHEQEGIEHMLKVAGVAILISIFVATCLLLATLRPLKYTQQIMARLANGNLSEIPEHKQQDEFLPMMQSLGVFRENALKMNALAESFEREVQGVVTIVAAASTQLSQTAQDMASSVRKNTEMVVSTNKTASTTTDNVHSVAAAAEELSASVKEISKQLQKTTGLVAQSSEKASNADALARAVTNASERVAGVMEIISKIASKINLLALNATIEAARAGDAGKGFAVVAEEVKSLANQTNKSVTDIQTVVEEMRSASRDITAALSDIKHSVGNISEATSSAASAVEEQAAVTNEIAKNMQTVASGAQLICENMTTIGTSSTQAETAAEQTLQASQELSKQAEILNTQVDMFLQKVKAV
jgi:methyl-accepting chemotaxis protein